MLQCAPLWNVFQIPSKNKLCIYRNIFATLSIFFYLYSENLNFWMYCSSLNCLPENDLIKFVFFLKKKKALMICLSGFWLNSILDRPTWSGSHWRFYKDFLWWNNFENRDMSQIKKSNYLFKERLTIYRSIYKFHH